MKKEIKSILFVFTIIVLLGIWSCLKEIDVKSNPSEASKSDNIKGKIINGEYITSTGTAEYLFNLKTSYIGDDLEISKLLEALDVRIYGHYSFALTSKNPYILKINYSQVEGWGNILNKPEVVQAKSALLLALIDNIDEVHWTAEKKTRQVTVSEKNAKYGNIKEYGTSAENLKVLLTKLDYYDNPITMSIKSDDLTNAGLTLIIKNHTSSDYLFGEAFSIMRKENDKWIDILPLTQECAFNLMGYTLKADEETQSIVNWEYCKGRLTKGHYRITKDFSYISPDTDNVWYQKKYFVSAEFLI